MKLIFAIVNNDDAHSVSSALTQGGFSCENSAVDGIIATIAQNSRKRKQYVPNAASLSAKEAPESYPVEVSVGGATVFVTDIERFEKL